MPKILQVCNTSFYLKQFLSSLIIDLVNEGFEVDCACEGDVKDEKLIKITSKIYPVVFPREISPLSFFTSIIRLSKIIRRGSYDCVQSHNRNASIVARISSWICKVPINLYTAHGMYYHDGQGSFSHRSSLFFERVMSKITTYTLSQSEEDSERMVSNGTIRSERIETITNGVDTEVFSPTNERTELEKKLGLPSDVLRVATTCRLVQQKGVQDLISAFGRLKAVMSNVELVIIGGNIHQDREPFQDKILEKIRNQCLRDQVIITGLVDNVEEYLAVSDIFVLPSYREGMPKSVIEAMAVGLPVIATRIRGCKELVTHRISGYLYEAGNVDQLFHYIRKLTLSDDERQEFGSSGREKALAEFQISDYNRKQIIAIKNLFNQHQISC